MRLGIHEINEGIYEAAIAKTIRQLTREKFEVIRDYRIENVDNLSVQVDLFAFNSYEKRIYEFKIGRNRIQRNQFERLQHYAREIGARLFVIYLEVPSSKRISFNHIEPIIHKDMAIKRPAELFDIHSITEIKHIENVDIEFAEIDDEIHLISPRIIEPIQKLKTDHFGNRNPRLHTDEVLIALSICANTDKNAELALNQLARLRGTELHSSVILSSVDEKVFKRLGIRVTCEPVFK
jgi:uncharacterized protein (UPF0371 family)